MQFFFIILILCTVLFLYRLYHLANDDLYLTKKNINIDDVFNTALFASVISLFFSRLFYVLLFPSNVFHSILGFLLFPYFPGLSLTGGLVGGITAVLIYCRYKKFPVARLFDFFALSFIFILPIGLAGYFLLSQEFTTGGLLKLIIYVITLFIANIYLYPKAHSLEIKDGTISILFLIIFSSTSLLGSAIDHPGVRSFINNKENYILIAILILGLLLLLKQEIGGRINFKHAK